MTLFRNDTHRDLWIDRWCHTCFAPVADVRRAGEHTFERRCPILARALQPDRKTLPKQWIKTRDDQMEKSIRCNEYANQPPLNRRQVSQQTQPAMFDVEPHAETFVPVKGWPDKPTKNEVDHQ